MSRSRIYDGDGTLPPDDPAHEEFCRLVAVNGLSLQDAYCAVQQPPEQRSAAARVKAHRWGKYLANRIEYLRQQKATASEPTEPVDTSPQSIAKLMREINSALESAARAATAQGHAKIGNSIKASLVRHIGRIQRIEARRDGPAKTNDDASRAQALAHNIRRNFHYCNCEKRDHG